MEDPRQIISVLVLRQMMAIFRDDFPNINLVLLYIIASLKTHFLLAKIDFGLSEMMEKKLFLVMIINVNKKL